MSEDNMVLPRCEHCLMKRVAYRGARYCGAACSQCAEAGICGDLHGNRLCTLLPRHTAQVKHTDGKVEW